MYVCKICVQYLRFYLQQIQQSIVEDLKELQDYRLNSIFVPKSWMKNQLGMIMWALNAGPSGVTFNPGHWVSSLQAIEAAWKDPQDCAYGC